MTEKSPKRWFSWRIGHLKVQYMGHTINSKAGNRPFDQNISAYAFEIYWGGAVKYRKVWKLFLDGKRWG